MATCTSKRYTSQVEQTERDFFETKYSKMSMAKSAEMEDAAAMFLTAQKMLYGDKVNWESMTIEQKTPHGWIRPQFILTETMINGRWKYWIDFRAYCQLDKEAGKKFIEGRDIPQVQFLSTGQGNNIAKEMIHVCLKEAPGAYAHSQYEMLELFVDWLLYSFGNCEVKTLPSRITKEMNEFWYKNFKPQLVLILPDDYLGEIASEVNVAKSSAYFPTPMNVVEVMTRMTMQHTEATKYSTVNDPCLGSGRMLLTASNYSLRLCGQDINKFIHKVSLVNAYFYMPWAVESDKDTDEVLQELAEKYKE